jgi:predicted transcriptional regulator
MRPPRLFFFLLLLASCHTPTPAPSPSPSAGASAPLPDPIPEIVARLDGEPVYLRQIVPLARTRLNKAKDQDAEKPAILRQALRDYIDRELLLREALARGVEADTRTVQRLYDAARAEHPDEERWKAHLYQRGFDSQTFKDELRVQQTIEVLLERAVPAPEGASAEVVAARRAETARALAEHLRTKIRIETYL